MRYRLVLIFLVFLMPLNLVPNSGNSINLAKSINKICSIYGSIKDQSCENIADGVIAKFQYGKYDDEKALRESCIYQCELAKANKRK